MAGDDPHPPRPPQEDVENSQPYLTPRPFPTLFSNHLKPTSAYDTTFIGSHQISLNSVGNPPSSSPSPEEVAHKIQFPNFSKSFIDVLKNEPRVVISPKPTVHSLHYGVYQRPIHLKPTTTFHGKPAVIFSKSDKERFINNLKFVLIGKFSHGRPTMGTVKMFFSNLKLKGEYNLSVLDPKHLIIECQSFEDFVRIWVKLVWVVGGFTMRVFKWSENFNPSKESSVCPIWVHLPGLPLFLFDEQALSSLAYAIGNPLKIDWNNLNRTKLGCASFCVEIDVAATVTDKIWIEFVDEKSVEGRDGFWQKVVYDYMPPFCLTCAHLGHTLDTCKRRNGGCEEQVKDGKLQQVPVADDGIHLETPKVACVSEAQLAVQQGGKAGCTHGSLVAKGDVLLQIAYENLKGCLINEAKGCAVHGCADQVRADQGCAGQGSAVQIGADDARQTQNSVLLSTGQTCSGHGFMLCSKCSSEGRIQLGIDHGNRTDSEQFPSATLEDGEIGENKDGGSFSVEPDDGNKTVGYGEAGRSIAGDQADGKPEELFTGILDCAAARDQFPPEQDQKMVQEMQFRSRKTEVDKHAAGKGDDRELAGGLIGFADKNRELAAGADGGSVAGSVRYAGTAGCVVGAAAGAAAGTLLSAGVAGDSKGEAASSGQILQQLRDSVTEGKPAVGGDLEQMEGVKHVPDSGSLKVEEIQGLQNYCKGTKSQVGKDSWAVLVEKEEVGETSISQHGLRGSQVSRPGYFEHLPAFVEDCKRGMIKKDKKHGLKIKDKKWEHWKDLTEEEKAQLFAREQKAMREMDVAQVEANTQEQKHLIMHEQSTPITRKYLKDYFKASSAHINSALERKVNSRFY